MLAQSLSSLNLVNPINPINHGSDIRDFAHHPTEQYEEEKTIGEVVVGSSSAIKISGVVNSPEDGQPLPGVNVLLKGSAQGTMTDANGRFTITLLNPGVSPVLIFTFVGFKTVEHPLSVTNAEQEIRIELMYDEVWFLGEVVVYRWYSPRTWWWKIKSLF